MATSQRIAADPSHQTDSPKAKRQPRKQTTIYTIAKELGMSPSTVSRALHHPGRLNATTESRIREAAERLGYSDPDGNQTPKRPTTTQVVIIVPSLDDAATLRFIRGAHRRLLARGYQTLILQEDDVITQDGLSTQFRKVPACGVLMAGQTLRTQEIRTLARQVPLITVNRKIEHVHNGSINIAAAIDRMTQALRDAGHRTVTYLMGPNNSGVEERLREQLSDSISKRGMKLQVLAGCQQNPQAAPSILMRFLTHPTHAVVASDNIIATNFMAAALQQDIRIPDELSVIGFGDEQTASPQMPSLARISMPWENLGTECAEGLITLARGQAPIDTQQSAVFRMAASLGTHRKDLTAIHEPDIRASQPESVATMAAVKREPTTLTIMAMSFQDWDEAINDYMSTHPDIIIRKIRGGNSMHILPNYYERVRSGHDIPDILSTEYRWIPQMAEDRMLLDLSTPSIRTMFEPLFTANCWKAASYRGGLYGVPCDYDATVMFCRMDIFDQHGLTVPRTWQEMFEQGIALHQRSPEMFITTINIFDTASFIDMLYMASVSPWTIDHSGGSIHLMLDSEPVRRIASFIQRCIDCGVMKPISYATNTFYDELNADHIAAVVRANWFSENLARRCPDAQGRWTATLPPSFTDAMHLVTAHTGGSAWGISSYAPASKRNAALQFCFQLQTDPRYVDLHLHQDRTLASSTYFQHSSKLTGKIDPYFQQRLYDVFLESAEHLNPDFCYLPFMPYVETTFTDTMKPQFTVGGDIVGHLKQWQSQIASYARLKGYQVECA